MFVEAIPRPVRLDLAALAEEGVTRPFYLAGGTATALHLGHRISVDLDFFGPAHFDVRSLAERLGSLGDFRLERWEQDTLLGELEGVRVSFFRCSYPVVDATVQVLGTTVLGLGDLAAMKLEAIGQRGARRDFIDLYFICRAGGMGLSGALEWYQRKFAGLDVNLVHIVKSLGYFADAEADAMPEMLKPVSWEEIRGFFERESPRLFRELE